MQGDAGMRARRAFLTRDYGVDPDRQNLSDGSWLWPTVRQLLGYSSVERRLERAIVKELLKHPEARSVVLPEARMRSLLGAEWRERVVSLGQEGLSRVSHLVTESCVRVKVSFSNGALEARVY